jgi:hypothetical protein
MSDYPTRSELKEIRLWKFTDPQNTTEFHSFMHYIKSLWYLDEYFEEPTNNHNIYSLHTVGWSGNEDIIHAMQKNYLFWSLFWQKSERGGHYTFAPMEINHD